MLFFEKIIKQKIPLEKGFLGFNSIFSQCNYLVIMN